jgi:subfamily B ATP-binding cassette protein MsbA
MQGSKIIAFTVVSLIVAAFTALVLWRGAHLFLIQAMTLVRLTVFLSYLGKFFKPVQDLAKMTTSIAQASVALERIQAILDTDTVIPQKENAKDTGTLKGHIDFEHVAFAYEPDNHILMDVHFSIYACQRIDI